MHGGFDNDSPTVPTDAVMKLDSIQVLKPNAVLVGKIEEFLGTDKNTTPPGGRTPTNPGSASPNEPRSPIPGGITLVHP